MTSFSLLGHKNYPRRYLYDTLKIIQTYLYCQQYNIRSILHPRTICMVKLKNPTVNTYYIDNNKMWKCFLALLLIFFCAQAPCQ